MLAEAAIALFGGFVGGKKSHPDVLSLEHIGDQLGHRHVAGIERQINRFLTSFLASSPSWTSASSY